MNSDCSLRAGFDPARDAPSDDTDFPPHHCVGAGILRGSPFLRDLSPLLFCVFWLRSGGHPGGSALGNSARFCRVGAAKGAA